MARWPFSATIDVTSVYQPRLMSGTVFSSHSVPLNSQIGHGFLGQPATPRIPWVPPPPWPTRECAGGQAWGWRRNRCLRKGIGILIELRREILVRRKGPIRYHLPTCRRMFMPTPRAAWPLLASVRGGTHRARCGSGPEFEQVRERPRPSGPRFGLDDR